MIKYQRKWATHVMLNIVVRKFEYFKENLLLPGLEVIIYYDLNNLI